MKSIVTFSEDTLEEIMKVPASVLSEQDNERLVPGKEFWLFRQLFPEGEKLSRSDHRICRLLIRKMPLYDLLDLRDSGSLDWYCRRLIDEQLRGLQNPKTAPGHNKGWQVYFRDMKQRKKGCVAEAREKLCKAFDALSWSAQRSVLELFLTNGLKTDRLWALDRIKRDWALIGDCKEKELAKWKDLLLDLFIRYADKDCALIVVQHFEYDMVLRLEKLLIKSTDYKTVALRLGEQSGYEIDKTRLKGSEWLYIMAKLGGFVRESEAANILSLCIAKAVYWYGKDFMLRFPDDPSLLHDDAVGLAMWSMAKLGMWDLVQDFYEKDRNLKRELLRCGTEDERMLCLYRYLPQYFPEVPEETCVDRQGAEMVLREMIRNNPALADFIRELDICPYEDDDVSA